MFLTHCKLGVKRHFQVFPVCVDIRNSSITVRHQYPVITAQEELLLSTCRLNEVPFLFFYKFPLFEWVSECSTGHSGRLAAGLTRPQMNFAHCSR